MDTRASLRELPSLLAATSDLEVVGIRIEELVDLVLFNRPLHRRLVDIVDLNGDRVGWRGGALRWKGSWREPSGTHIRREVVDPTFEHVSLPLAPPAIPS